MAKELVRGMADPSVDEIERFDAWLRRLWTEKDELLAHFYAHGRFDDGPQNPSEEKARRDAHLVECPIRLKTSADLVRTIGLALPSLTPIAYALKSLF